MAKTTKSKENFEVCECGQYCLRSICESSDSGLIVKLCWCAECKERVAEIKANAGRIVITRAN